MRPVLPRPSRHIWTGSACRTRSDRLGNLICTIPGDPALPSVMIFTHMDQLGFIVRKVEDSGLIRLERLGGVPERALAAQAVVLCTRQGRSARRHRQQIPPRHHAG